VTLFAMSTEVPADTFNERSAPLVLIVTGAPASGKTILGRQLAAALGLPYFSKDLFKESLFDSLGWQDRAWSQRSGGASMDLLFRAAEVLLEAGQPVALECNFYPVDGAFRKPRAVGSPTPRTRRRTVT
jgi:hypothetical protein